MTIVFSSAARSLPMCSAFISVSGDEYDVRLVTMAMHCFHGNTELKLIATCQNLEYATNLRVVDSFELIWCILHCDSAVKVFIYHPTLEILLPSVHVRLTTLVWFASLELNFATFAEC